MSGYCEPSCRGSSWDECPCGPGDDPAYETAREAGHEFDEDRT